MARVFVREWRIVLHDPGVLIFFFMLPLMYPIIYTLIYNPEVLRKIDVVVVDDDRTAASRQLVRDMSASPTVNLYDYAANMTDAKEYIGNREAYAILHIPAGYGRNPGRLDRANVSLYVEMSLLLRYRDLSSAFSDIQLRDISQISGQRSDMLGSAGSLISSSPISNQSNMMGDTQQGFASFLMPGIVVLILQQSMVLGIAMLGGTSRERRRRNGGIDPEMIPGAPATAVVWGRTLCYFVMYIVPTMFLLQWIPDIFSLPHQGHTVDFLLLAVPLVLGSAFFGQTLNIFVTDRESSFIVMVITSVFFLFLAGFTWPRYIFPDIWRWISNFVPAVWGVQGFIHINSTGATLAENSEAFLWLWGLVIMYFATSVLTLRLVARRERRRALSA